MLSPCVIVEGGLSLDMQNSLTVREGDRLSLTCTVKGGQGQLSVTWQRKATSPPAAAFTSVISLNQDGVMEEGPAFAGRHVRAARPATDTFTLELDRAAPADAGLYQCLVSEWRSDSNANSQLISSNVTVAPTGERRLRLRRTNHSRIIHGASCIFDVSVRHKALSAALFQLHS